MVKNTIGIGIIILLAFIVMSLSSKIGKLQVSITHYKSALASQENNIAKSYESALILEQALKNKEYELEKVHEQSNNFREEVKQLQSKNQYFKDWYDTHLSDDVIKLLKNSSGGSATENSAANSSGTSK